MVQESKTPEEYEIELDRYILHRINDYLYKKGVIPRVHYEGMRRRIYQYKPKK